VSRIAQEALEDFDPLTDAIAPTFRGQAITVDIIESVTAELAGEKFNLEPGEHELPEHVGVFLMARGAAEKARE
jgi:DNA primase small subunit